MSKFQKGINYAKKSLKNSKKWGLSFSTSQILGKILPNALPPKFGFIYNHFELKTKRNIDKYLTDKYGYVIDKYANLTKEEYTSNSQSKVIWIMWLQGIENAPLLVQKCLDSIKRENPDIPVNLLTENNLDEYVDIPDVIIQKYKDGKISPAHLADLTRSLILKKYGGLWLDATIFCKKHIPDLVFENNFFTVHRKKLKYPLTIVNGRWVTFFLYASKGSKLFEYVSDFLVEYWKKEDSAIDYLLIDYVLDLGYQHIPEFRNEIDNVPISTDDIFILEKLMNEGFSDSIKEDIQAADTSVFKLSVRDKHLEQTSDGTETVYKKYVLNK